MKIIIIANSAWNLLNFRAELIKALLKEGHEIILVAPADKYVLELNYLGVSFIDLNIKSHSLNPLNELVLLTRYILLLRNVKPNIVLAFTVKPNIYGALAGMVVGIPIINNITGLGSGFIKGGLITKILKILYKIALRKSRKIFFQNSDDLKLFIQLGLAKTELVELISGSGVNLKKFSFQSLSWVDNKNAFSNKKFIFLMVGRLLRDKGICEYVEAARTVKKKYTNIEFALIGFFDESNPNSVHQNQLKSWITEGVISYWGESQDVRRQIALADCVVLPSYREGTPRSLLEAAAMGRPLIATDVPGCREIVRDNFNGLLCRLKDSEDLAEKMISMATKPTETLEQWGLNSRKLVENLYDENMVIKKYINVINLINNEIDYNTH